MKSKDIQNYLDSKLNILGANYGISFDGGVGFYNHDWVKEKFDIRLTPYVLVTNVLQRKSQKVEAYTFRYSLVILGFEKDRETLEDLLWELREELDYAKIGGFNTRFLPVAVNFYNTLSEGSGLGTRRFEAVFEFEGKATKALDNDDLVLTFDGNDIAVNSYKYEQSKTSLINKSEYNSENNKNQNNDILVVETILTSDNYVLNNLINKKEMVNIDKLVVLKLGGIEIINDNYRFENFSLVADNSNGDHVAFLYFSKTLDRGFVNILGYEIPILDYAISTVIDMLPHSNPNSNIYKNLYLGKATSYAFHIVEDEAYSLVLDKLESDLMSENEELPFYDIEIKLRNEVYTKRLILSDISKEANVSNKGVLVVKFLEGAEL